MKIAFIGDIVGRPGRRIIKDNLKKIRDEYTGMEWGEFYAHKFSET